MNGDIVAQRYAKALFALGQQEGMAKLEQYGENLSALEGVLEDSPELVRLFHIPVISVAEKQKVLSQVLDKLDVDPMIKISARCWQKRNVSLFLKRLPKRSASSLMRLGALFAASS